MKVKRCVISVLALGLISLFPAFPAFAQTPRSLILLYSNNISGETDPCPT